MKIEQIGNDWHLISSDGRIAFTGDTREECERAWEATELTAAKLFHPAGGSSGA